MFANGFFSSSQGLEDAGNYIWLLWHTSRGLPGENPIFFTDLLFYPFGASLKFDAPILNSIISFPISHLFGPMASYNFLILFSFLTTFWGFYLFLKYVSRSKIGGLVGALIFTFSAYRMTVFSLGQLDLLSTNWIGFTLYFIFRFFDNPKKIKNIFLSALFFNLNAYTDYRTFAIFGLFIVTLLLIKTITKFGMLKKGVLFFFLFSIIFISPLVAINFNNANISPRFTEVDSPRITATDLLAFVYPFKSLTSKYYSMAMPYVGVVSSILLFIYFLFIKKTNEDKKYLKIFTLLLLIFGVFSLGSEVRVFGKQVFESRFMPFVLLKNLPIFTFLRSPARFSLDVNIAISVLSAIATKSIFTRVKNKTFYNLLLTSVVFLTITHNFLFIPKINFNQTTKFSFLDTLQQKPNGNVLYIPFGYQDSFDQPNGIYTYNILLSQIHHQKPMVGGYLSYVNPNTLEALHYDKFLQNLISCQKGFVCSMAQDTDTKTTIERYNLKYLIIEKDTVNKKTIDFLSKSFKLRVLDSNKNFDILEIVN